MIVHSILGTDMVGRGWICDAQTNLGTGSCWGQVCESTSELIRNLEMFDGGQTQMGSAHSCTGIHYYRVLSKVTKLKRSESEPENGQ